ncbi:MAG: response regulator [Deltaproteobacteria bacterium]|nr:response regulator [Deltaproteobacteria bacterium]
MTIRKYRILIVDDERNILHAIQHILVREGFDCTATPSGRKALEIVEKNPPDLMILDVNMPEINGIEICEQVKKNLFLSHIPILMLTGRTRIEDRVTGLDSGADDYLCKPFDNRELVARIRALIRHTVREADRNPTTNLPGNAAVERELAHRIEQGEGFAVCYPDLDNFKAYSDTYGFDAANKVIQLTGRIIAGVVMLEGDEEDFIGHIGGDDFLLVTRPGRAEDICRKIVREFDEKIPSFYETRHLAQGGFVGKDRAGEMKKFPIMSISIAVVIDEQGHFHNLSEIGKLVAKVKKEVKQLAGSQYRINRR